MKTILLLGLSFVVASGFVSCSRITSREKGRKSPPVENKLPPLPPGTTELKFSDFFVTPVGPRGLELTDKLRGLDGKRVRLLGYMVQRENAPQGKFLFTALPVQLHEHDSEFADDLPPATVHVSVPTCRDRRVPYAPGLMLLTGMLSLGPREEADGRISLVRLALDPPERGKNANGTQYDVTAHIQHDAHAH